MASLPSPPRFKVVCRTMGHKLPAKCQDEDKMRGLNLSVTVVSHTQNQLWGHWEGWECPWLLGWEPRYSQLELSLSPLSALPHLLTSSWRCLQLVRDWPRHSEAAYTLDSPHSGPTKPISEIHASVFPLPSIPSIPECVGQTLSTSLHHSVASH